MKRSIFKTYVLFIPALIMALTLVSCDDSSTDLGTNGGNGNETEEPGPDEVWMVGRSFSPANIEVEVGTTVTWTNKSNLIHTVTSGSGRTADEMFNSGNLSNGDIFTYTFNDVGVFDYFCIPHESMTATITVVDQSGG